MGKLTKDERARVKAVREALLGKTLVGRRLTKFPWGVKLEGGYFIVERRPEAGIHIVIGDDPELRKNFMMVRQYSKDGKKITTGGPSGDGLWYAANGNILSGAYD